MRRFTALGTVAAVTALVVTATPAAAEGKILGTENPAVIEDSYIVTYRDAAVSVSGVDAVTDGFSDEYDLTATHTYRHAFRGFAGTFNEEVARKLAAEPVVASVQQNARVEASDTQPNPPSWGLDRIDQRDLPLANGYTYPNTAANVTAYIIDTGIRTSHQDFGGRATWGTNTVDNVNTDCHGHGTHVAGTVGGSAHGVAKGVRLIAVKVLDCDGSGTTATVAAGVDWVTGHHTGGPAVANMSLGGPAPQPVSEAAVRASIADGVTYAVAAGNEYGDACDASPANVAEAITVSASDSEDYRAIFSNYGTCTDIFAPGVDITSAWNGSDSDTLTIDGTSMAAPHVAGAAALLLGAEPTLTPDRVADAMFAAATPDKVNDAGPGSPNRLLFVAGGGGVPGGPVVANPGNRTDTAGTAVSLQLSASGGAPPYTWTAGGLPSGLSVSPTGLVSGTVTTPGTFGVTVTATDTGGRAGSGSFTWTVNPQGGGGCASPGQKLVNPGFESGETGWTDATYTIGPWTGDNAPRSGSRSAWLNGYGEAMTETLQQTVAIPAGCVNSRLTLYLKIHSGEYSSGIAYDTLTIRVGSTVLATYSNIDESPYTLRSFPVGAYAGRTVTIAFTGAEDSSLPTSFVLDDLALNAG
ncbi:S8 family peptidase [Actinosynnema sp. NPDC059797]